MSPGMGCSLIRRTNEVNMQVSMADPEHVLFGTQTRRTLDIDRHTVEPESRTDSEKPTESEISGEVQILTFRERNTR